MSHVVRGISISTTILLFILLLELPLGAEPLQRGWSALESGNWQEAKRLFAQVGNLEGRLALARVELVLGRPERALKHLQGQSDSELVMRMEALHIAGQFTKAHEVLRELEKRKHSAFSSPYDFHFYRVRGTLERDASNFDLARKNILEAERRAKSPDQEALALTELSWVWLLQEETEKATLIYAKLEALLPQTRSVWTVARILDVGFGLNRQRGDRTNAMALKRAARELFLARGNKTKAAAALVNIRNLESFRRDVDQNIKLSVQALEEFLAAEDWRGAADRLSEFRYLASEVGARVPELESHLDAAISRFPKGEWRDRALLSRADFLLESEASALKVKQAFNDLTSSSSTPIRAHAYLGLAKLAHQQGDYQKARAALENSLALASPQSKYDRDWKQAPGYTLLEMARLENVHHRYPQALDLARRAVSSQRGNDWTAWRIQARRQSLAAALAMHDSQAAVEEFRASLEDIKTLPRIWSRASALTQMTGALLINESVREDVLEPTDLLFEDYDDVVQSLVQEVYSNPDELAYLLDTFDGWRAEAQRRQQVKILGYPSIQKGLILEAIGRRAQARDSFRNGIRIAQENDVPGAPMVGYIMLARLAALEGRTEEAADYATTASELASQVNKRVARLYALVAGGAQREAGRLSESLESFDLAIAQNPEKAWPGLFGRALTKEKMKQSQGALSDIEAALELLKDSDFSSSRAKVVATKARLLSRLGRESEAQELFAQALQQHRELGASRYWPQLALDYSKSLEKSSRHRESLTVLTQAVDQLVDWQTPSFRKSQHLFEHTVATALKQRENKTALRYLQMSRSAEFLDSIDLGDIEANPETQALLKEVKTLKLRLEQLRENRAKGKQSDSLGQQLAATREDFFAKLAELRTKDPDFEALVSVSGSQLTSLQELLSERSVLLEYFPARDKLYIFAVSPDNFLMHEVAVSRRELEQLTQMHLEGLTKPGKLTREQVKLAQRLRLLLLDPIKPNQYDKVRIVPSGPIWQVPLSTLRDENGEALNRRLEFSYLTSSDILRIFRNHSAASEQPQSALLVGGAPQLRGVAREVEQLKNLLPSVETLVGNALSLRSFRTLVKERAVIHIASHSFASPDTKKTYIQLGSTRLRLGQVYGLRLKPGAMVVLSSCQSAVGASANPGREVTSLASAFGTAGASTVIASRWKVDDQSTTDFFSFFYRALLNGKSRGQALRQAQLDMMQVRPHPYFWAGFSLFGDPGEPTPR